MYKLININSDEFDSFAKEHLNYVHFLQTSSWGEFRKSVNKNNPYFLGLVDKDNNLQAATLLLETKLISKYTYFYAPRGFIIDYDNFDLLNTFTNKIVDFIKSKSGIYFEIDPEIIIKETTSKGDKISHDYNKVFNNLINSNFKHKGFSEELSDSNQVRYTFQIDFSKDFQDIENDFSKSAKKNIAYASNLEINFYKGDENDIDTFYKLMVETELRKGFISYDLDYYKKLYKTFNNSSTSSALLFLCSINFDKTITKLKNDLKELEKPSNNKNKHLTPMKEKINKEINKFINLKQEYGNELILSANYLLRTNDSTWTVYAANHSLANSLFTPYYSYYKHMKYMKTKNITLYDHFGCVKGDDKSNKAYGLYEFKKRFGGNHVEFIGDFIYITNKPIYSCYKILIPIYRFFKRINVKKKIAKEDL